MTLHGVHFDETKIAEFCRRHGIASLSLYGSVLRDDFGPDSDIDVLVEFPPGGTPSLLELGGMQVELSELLGREVDLKTPGFLSSLILERVLSERVVQYADRVLYVPGEYCYATEWEPAERNTMRLSFGVRSCEEIHRGIELLADAISEVTP